MLEEVCAVVVNLHAEIKAVNSQKLIVVRHEVANEGICGGSLWGIFEPPIAIGLVRPRCSG